MNDSVATELRFSKPSAKHGHAMWGLVKHTGVLDLNSSYAYMLLGRDFSDACVLVWKGDDLVGMITGYRLPERQEVLFIWQVAVHESMRGQGLAPRMIRHILQRNDMAGVTNIETTVTPDNKASRRLFEKTAASLQTELNIQPGFPAEYFPEGNHEPEERYVIGPFDVGRLMS